MSPDKVEPALTAQQWAEWKREIARAGGVVDDTLYNDTVGKDAAECAYVIALNNDALPADDKRKITREDVANLRGILSGDAWAVAKADIARLADALESYLPLE